MKRPLPLLLICSILTGCTRAAGEPDVENVNANQGSETMNVNPQDILFSLPTLNNEIPAPGSTLAGNDCYRMHEDDWRQFEIVSRLFDADIAAELTDIDQIWREQSVPLGDTGTAFRNVHVRQRITEPLNVAMSLADFETLFDGQASPMTFHDYESVLLNVHAIRLENVVFYAVIRGERTTTIGIEPLDRLSISGEVAERLQHFLIKHDLALVHWPSRTLFDTPQSAIGYLRGMSR